MIEHYPLQVARGRANKISSILKFGANPSIADGTTEDVWDLGGTYPVAIGAPIEAVWQATDTAADRGEEVEVQGLDEDGKLTVQTVTLDGSNSETVVLLPTLLSRVFRMRYLSSKVAGANIIAGEEAGTEYAAITAGNNQSLMAVYTIPTGYKGYLTSYYADIVEATAKLPDSCEFKLWVADRTAGYTFQLKHAKAIPKQGSGFQHQFGVPMALPAGADIKISASPSGDPASVHAGFDIVLVAD